MFSSYDLKIYEDLGISKSKIKILSKKEITDQTLNLIISIPNFESNSFKGRSFEFAFETKKSSEVEEEK